MEQDIHACAQQKVLIDFLYGELSELEGRAFQRHVKECPGCAAELDGLNSVRRSVVAWRDESIGRADLPADSRFPVNALPQRSAVAALREFFNLSPLWMKGAVGFAAVLFCVLAVIAVARFQENKPAPVAVVPNGPSQEELNALVQQRVQEELEKRKQLETDNLKDTVARHLNSEQSRPFKKRESVAVNPLNHSPRRPLSRVEREQLAMDLGLVNSNDSELDLLDDKINQP